MRIAGVVFNLAAQATNVGPEVLILLAVFWSPDGLEQGPVGENTTGVEGKMGQQVVFSRRQFDRFILECDRLGVLPDGPVRGRGPEHLLGAHSERCGWDTAWRVSHPKTGCGNVPADMHEL